MYCERLVMRVDFGQQLLVNIDIYWHQSTPINPLSIINY